MGTSLRAMSWRSTQGLSGSESLSSLAVVNVHGVIEFEIAMLDIERKDEGSVTKGILTDF